MWRHLSDPALWPNERLFFEIYGQALQARPHTVDFLDDIVESWLEPVAAMRPRARLPRRQSPTRRPASTSRCTRGLLLDLLATGDRAAADAAIEQAITLFETWRAKLPTVPSTNASDPPDQSARPRLPTRARPRPRACSSISGSLRRTSTNTAVLRTAAALAPDGVTTVLYDALAALPHFNPDDDVVPLHPAVNELRAQIRPRRCGVVLDARIRAVPYPARSRTFSTGRSATTNRARSTRSPSRGSTRRSVVLPTRTTSCAPCSAMRTQPSSSRRARTSPSPAPWSATTAWSTTRPSATRSRSRSPRSFRRARAWDRLEHVLLLLFRHARGVDGWPTGVDKTFTAR